MFTISNQTPVVLDPVYKDSYTGDFDPMNTLKEVLVDPIYHPLNSNATVNVLQDGNLFTDGELTTLWETYINTDSIDLRDTLDDLYSKCMAYYHQNDFHLNEIFVIQAASKAKLPWPSNKVIYTASDIVDSATEILLNSQNATESFFSSIAFNYKPQTLGVAFRCEQDFKDFQAFLANNLNSATGSLPTETISLTKSFMALTLSDLTESLILRNDTQPGVEENCFPRFIIQQLLNYIRIQNNPSIVSLLPFSVDELFCPQTLILVNVEAHSKAKAKQVHKAWSEINESLSNDLPIISTRSLTKLNAMSAARNRAKAQLAALHSSNKNANTARRSLIKFRKTKPKAIDITKDLMKILKRMTKVNMSQNIFKQVRTSFTKPNRRDPMNYNKPGKIVSTSYLPDIHIYLDTSGSITENDYKETIISLIALSKKLNVNLYFNSFSHLISEEFLLKVNNRSVNQVYLEFQKIPKVTGGTDFKNVWTYIQKSRKRRRQLSLMITDFEYAPDRNRVDHPVNLYYAPITSNSWPMIQHSIKYYIRSMRHIEKHIERRILGAFQ